MIGLIWLDYTLQKSNIQYQFQYIEIFSLNRLLFTDNYWPEMLSIGVFHKIKKFCMNVHASISSFQSVYERVHFCFFVIHFLCPFITGIQNATYPCIADERNCRKLKTKKNVSHQFVSKVLSELENILRQTTIVNT